MEVVISKVEELKVLIDSATERVKGSSVHCLQELLHHLVAFYSTQRFVFFSLVVVDTKTGKEQRFYTFRDLLDHSKYLLSQTGQNKNVQNNQYLERVLGNKGSASSQSTESSWNASEASPQNTSQSHSSSGNQGNHQSQERDVRQSAHSYPPPRTQISQPQCAAVSCPQPRVAYIEAGSGCAPGEHPGRPLARQANQGPPVTSHHLRSEDPACLQKDNSGYVIHRLPPESSVPVAVTASQNYASYHYNDDTISLAPNPAPSETGGRSTHSNRDHPLLIQTNEQTYLTNQPRSTVSQFMVEGHNAAPQMQYSMSNMQLHGHNEHNMSTSYPERRENVVINRPAEYPPFNMCDTSIAGTGRNVQTQSSAINLERRSGYAESNSRPVTHFPASTDRSMNSRTLHVSQSHESSGQNFHQESPVSVRRLEEVADNDSAPHEQRDWSSGQRRAQVQRKKVDSPNPAIQPFTESRHSYAATPSVLYINDESLENESLDLTGSSKDTPDTAIMESSKGSADVTVTGSSKGSPDLALVSEVDARRALSRMTNTPMIPPRPILQNLRSDRSIDTPHLSIQPVCWSSCTKETSTFPENLFQEQPISFVSQESLSHRFNGSLLDKDQALNALLAKKLTEGTDTRAARPAPSTASRTAASTGRDCDSGSEVNSTQQGTGRNLRKTRNVKRIKLGGLSRRKSSSPQKIAVSDSTQKKGKTPPNETKDDSTDDEADNDSIAVVSDSANDEDLDDDSSASLAEIPKRKNCMRYYCFYCKEVNCKVTQKDLLHHMSFHEKTSGDKTGLPCLQCGKLFKHKAQGIEGMYSTMLACLNHMMCQHSCEVPDYMQVHKCSQCSFVSLMRNVVKRHEQCHVQQEPDSQCNEIKTTTQKQKRQQNQAQARPAISENSSNEHSCSYCKKIYSSKSALAIHVERKHKNINSFLCNKCPSSFYAKVDLERHMYAQHAVNISKRAVIKCSICDYQSLEGSLMRKHIKNHQTGSFICDICSKEFGTQNRLKSHRMIHTAERKYKCDDCDYATAKRYHYERHVAVRHKGQFWKCSSCSMLSFNQNNLQKHINKAHKGNAEIKEVENLKDSSGDKKPNKQNKKKGIDPGAKKSNVNVASDGCHENPTGSNVQMLSNALNANKDGGLTTMANFQEAVQTNISETNVDSSMGMVLDQQSQGLVTVKSNTLLWQLQ